jgi:hypothetical protein
MAINEATRVAELFPASNETEISGFRYVLTVSSSIMAIVTRTEIQIRDLAEPVNLAPESVKAAILFSSLVTQSVIARLLPLLIEARIACLFDLKEATDYTHVYAIGFNPTDLETLQGQQITLTLIEQFIRIEKMGQLNTSALETDLHRWIEKLRVEA